MDVYRKQQCLSRRKVLRFIGFHHSVEKFFVVFEHIIIGTRNHTYKLEGKCRDSWKICTKVFSCLTFVVYDISSNS